MVLTFGLFDAGNDRWWAVDNVEVVSGTPSAAFLKLHDYAGGGRLAARSVRTTEYFYT